jgi:hypothetical protein
MAPIRSNPKLMGFQKGCSQLLGKSRGDRMLGSGPIGGEELLTIRTHHTIQRYSPPWAPYQELGRVAADRTGGTAQIRPGPRRLQSTAFLGPPGILALLKFG